MAPTRERAPRTGERRAAAKRRRRREATGAAGGPAPPALRAGGTWLAEWNPEDAAFWRRTGARIAWQTLAITTSSLVLSFITWFMVSALVVRLPGVGYGLTTGQLLWLTAMPGVAGGTLRIVWTFLPPLLGTRHLVTLSTLLLAIPVIGWSYAIRGTGTPYSLLLVLAFLAGVGGGNFSGFMPSTSYFFPRRLQGTALGIQAGVGNFGVSVVQFLTPWIVGFPLFGSALLGLGRPQLLVERGAVRTVWLQNAALVWLLFILLAAALAWVGLRSVPVRANFREQLDIFRDKHTWIMTSLYFMTFGSFSGFSATFPLMIRELFGRFEGAPDPLGYAFLGPLVGSAVRVVFGPVADRIGGGRLTLVSGAGLGASAVAITPLLHPGSLAAFPYFVAAMLSLFFFAGLGNASTFKQMPMIFPPRQAGGVIGWTAAIAAYGPFVFSSLMALVIAQTGTPVAFFWGAAAFYLVNVALNAWFYARRGAPKPC